MQKDDRRKEFDSSSVCDDEAVLTQANGSVRYQNSGPIRASRQIKWGGISGTARVGWQARIAYVAA